MENDRIWTLLTRKLSGEASQTELRELEYLINGTPGSEKLVAAVSESWSAGASTDNDFLEATYLQHLERMKAKGFSLDDNPVVLNNPRLVYRESPKPRSYWKEVMLSAMLLALIAVTLFIVKNPNEPLPSKQSDEQGVLSTANGSRSKIILPDGSGVWLNAGSKLNYEKTFKSNIREVTLTGEAFFDVLKDPKRPFVIHTAKMDIKVLGTRFNVKAYDTDRTFETSLISGSVEVVLTDEPAKKYYLKPKQKLVLREDQLRPVTPGGKPSSVIGPVVEIREITYIPGTNADVESSWTRNILSFEDESFLDVSKKMERWYDVKFEFRNKMWENEFLSGTFEKETIEQAMTALKFTTGFNYKIKDKIILIY